MPSTNRIMILFTLSQGRKSLYELSKLLSSNGRKKSSGTLVPIMRKLEAEGYVSKERSGRVRYYSLTETGRKHVGKLKKLRGEIRRGFLASFLRQEILVSETRKKELLLSPDFVKQIEIVYEQLGDEIIELISGALNMAIEGNYYGLSETKMKLRGILGEINNAVQ
ncbi:MAG: helix-turn-helix transcriptional regulator [Thermoplasmatales archaeon]